jgi:hypothetical protein
LRQAFGAGGQRNDRNLSEIREKERRAPHFFQFAARSAGDRFLNKAVVQADAQLVMQQAKTRSAAHAPKPSQ